MKGVTCLAEGGIEVPILAFTFVCWSRVAITVKWVFAEAGFGAIPAILVSWACCS
jgi:hypothetical protein